MNLFIMIDVNIDTWQRRDEYFSSILLHFSAAMSNSRNVCWHFSFAAAAALVVSCMAVE